MSATRRQRQAEYLARMTALESAYTVLVKNLKGTDHSEDAVLDRRIILK
jgi:hypothetical protein